MAGKKEKKRGRSVIDPKTSKTLRMAEQRLNNAIQNRQSREAPSAPTSDINDQTIPVTRPRAAASWSNTRSNLNENDATVPNVLVTPRSSAIAVSNDGNPSSSSSDRESLLPTPVSSITEIAAPSRSYHVPEAPKINEQKLQRSIDKIRAAETDKRLANKESKRETSNEFYTGNNANIESVLIELEKENEKLKNEIEETEKKLQDDLDITTWEEHNLNQDLAVLDINLQEINAAKKLDNSEKYGQTEAMIPTEENFNQAREFLKKFLLLRNQKLLACGIVENKLNQTSDRYADLLARHRTRMGHLDSVVERRKRTGHLGDRVLRMGTMLLENMYQNLKEYDDRIFGDHFRCGRTKWFQKVKHFERNMEFKHGLVEKLKSILIEKKQRILELKTELKNLDREKKECTKAVKNAEKSFEESVVKDERYITAVKIGQQKKEVVSRISKANQDIRKHIEDLRKRMEAADIVSEETTETIREYEKLQEKIHSKKKTQEENQKTYEAAKRHIQVQRKQILQEEQRQNDIREKIEEQKKELRRLEEEYPSKVYHHELSCKRFRQFLRQAMNYAREDCKPDVLRCLGQLKEIENCKRTVPVA